MPKFHGNFRYFLSCFLSSDKLANRGKFLDISVKFPETWRLFPKALSKLLLYFNHSPLSEFLVSTVSQYFQRSTQVVWKTLQGKLPANAPIKLKNIVVMLYALHNLTCWFTTLSLHHNNRAICWYWSISSLKKITFTINLSKGYPKRKLLKFMFYMLFLTCFRELVRTLFEIYAVFFFSPVDFRRQLSSIFTCYFWNNHKFLHFTL